MIRDWCIVFIGLVAWALISSSIGISVGEIAVPR